MRMHRRTLWTLYLGNLFTAIGLWFFLPLLPIFIGRKGGGLHTGDCQRCGARAVESVAAQ